MNQTTNEVKVSALTNEMKMSGLTITSSEQSELPTSEKDSLENHFVFIWYQRRGITCLCAPSEFHPEKQLIQTYVNSPPIMGVYSQEMEFWRKLCHSDPGMDTLYSVYTLSELDGEPFYWSCHEWKTYLESQKIKKIMLFCDGTGLDNRREIILRFFANNYKPEELKPVFKESKMIIEFKLARKEDVFQGYGFIKIADYNQKKFLKRFLHARHIYLY